MTPSGIEPATFRFVAQHLNQFTLIYQQWIFVKIQQFFRTFKFYRSYRQRNYRM